jgi:hypothetical protein
MPIGKFIVRFRSYRSVAYDVESSEVLFLTDYSLRAAARAVFRASLSGAVIAGLSFGATPSFAQTMPDVNAGIGADAARATLLRNAASQASPAPAASVAPAAAPAVIAPPPITDADAQKPGFHTDPIIYSADISTNLAGGATNSARNLPGTFDASIIYTFARTTRVGAYYYQYAAYPLGNDDKIPVVFQGTKTPIGYVNGNQQGINADTDLRFQLYTIQQLFTVGGRHHPLVIAPFYGNVRSTVGRVDDTQTIFVNNQVETVHLRSYERYGINLTIPLFYDINYLVTYGADATKNTHPNGANLTNNIQFEQNLYAQYKLNDDVTVFGSGAINVQYFPTDVYPYHSPTFHYGITKVIKAPFFIEAEISTTGPQNPNYSSTGRIGIPQLVVPCASTAAGKGPTFTCVAEAANGVAVPVLGAQRATTFSLMLGIGAHPLVQPF